MHQASLSESEARALVAPFYDALNAPATKDVRALVESVAAPGWRSHAANAVSKGREEFIQQVIGFGRGIPDLAWNIDEVVVAGDRIVVRSEATGTPAGEFLGVPHGGRSFRVMTLDLHTVAEGRLVRADHVEDWASAMRQLRG
jgi:predicted ester cyclase